MKTDVQLQRDVLDELNWDPGLDAAQIGVTVHEGVVTLTGHLPVYIQKHHAEEVAKRLHGVRAVANEIAVRPTDAHVRDDEEIATAAVHGLMWNANVPEAQLKVAVEDGWITVEGFVCQQFQKVEAERVLQNLAGVKGVTNAIAVKPVKTSMTACSDIEAAFRRSAALHGRELSAVVDGTTVTLTGGVHSYSELEEATRIAWSAPGVQHVQNCITVTPWGSGSREEWGY